MDGYQVSLGLDLGPDTGYLAITEYGCTNVTGHKKGQITNIEPSEFGCSVVNIVQSKLANYAFAKHEVGCMKSCN